MNNTDHDQRTLIDEVVTLDNMTELRAHVLRLAAHAGLACDRAEDFAIAVHEAVTNAIRHAGGRGEFSLIQDDARSLIAEVSDGGPGLPCAIVITMPSADSAGGRGLWLARQLADQVEIRSGGDCGTRVRLEMSLRAKR